MIEQVALIGGQTGCPYWGTNRLPFWADKQVALIGGQIGCPFELTNRLPLLGDKQVALLGWQTCCPYWGTNRLPLLRDKQIAFIGETNRLLSEEWIIIINTLLQYLVFQPFQCHIGNKPPINATLSLPQEWIVNEITLYRHTIDENYLFVMLDLFVHW